MACVLFNGAVIESQIGGAEPRKSPESIVRAVKSFLSAAGLFQFIKDTICPKIVEKITPDISAESLDCLCALMLAQAQQCVTEKGILGKMKKDSIAKLAQECASMYANVASRMQSSTLNGLFDRHWQGYSQSKAHYYQAVANQYIAYQMNEEDEKGAEIARLYKARELIDQASSCRVSSEMKQIIKDFIDEIKNNTSKAHKENDKVYHDRVPPTEELPAIDKKRIATAKVPESLVSLTGIEDPFRELFPVPVMEAQQRFKEELNAKLAASFRYAREHRDNVKQKLAQQGLPGSIMTDEKQPGFPDQVHKGIDKIRQQGGLNRLRSLRVTLKEMANETHSQCDKLSDQLKEEEAEDTECRKQFHSSWSRLPSQQLTVNLQRELNKYRSKVEQASNSDSLIDDKISKHEVMFQKFDLNRQEIDEMMPRPDSSAQTNTSQAQNQLRDLLSQLDDMFGREADLEKSLQQEQELEGQKIKGDLLKNQSNLDSTINQYLSNFDTKLQEFQDLSQKEDSLYSDIKGKYTSFAQGRTETQSQHQRQEVVQRMFETIRMYDEIMANVREGIGFYSAMQDFIEKLGQRIGDFIWARKMEKGDLIGHIQQHLSGVHISHPYAQQPRPQQGHPQQQQGNPQQQQQQQYVQPPPQGGPNPFQQGHPQQQWHPQQNPQNYRR